MDSSHDNDKQYIESNFLNCDQEEEGEEEASAPNYATILSQLNRVKRSIKQLFTNEFCEMFNRLKYLDNPYKIQEKILELLCFYDRHKQAVQPKVLRKIMRRELPALCFEKQVANSDMVCCILERINKMDEEIPSSLTMFLMNAMNRQHVDLSPVYFLPSKRALTYLTYFLHHARIRKLTFNGKRLPELLLNADPDHLVTTILYSNSESVLTLLQYGARMLGEFGEQCVGLEPLLACAFEFIIYCGVTSALWDESLFIRVHPKTFSEYMKKMLRNLRLILRSVPNPHLSTFQLADIDLGSHKIRIPDASKLKLFFESVYPSCELAVIRAPSLQHVCKMAVRQTLFDNWQLPDGIYHLNLPKTVADYVNLMID